MHISRRIGGYVAAFGTAIVVFCVLYCVGGVPRDRYASYEENGYFGCSCTSVSAEDEICVFSTPARGRGDIYKASLREKRLIPVVASPETEYAPTISIDRKRITFVRDGSSGGRQIWLADLENGLETMVSRCGPDVDPIGVSNDGRYVLVRRTRPGGGMMRIAYAVVIATDTHFENEIGFTPAFLSHKTTVLCGSGIHPHCNVIVYDIHAQSSTVLCDGQLLSPIDDKSILVRRSDGKLCVIDIGGRVLRTISAMNDSTLVAIGGEWIAGTDPSRTRITVQRHDGDSDFVELPPLQGGWVITELRGSTFGFCAVVRNNRYGRWTESLVTASPPFEQWEWQFCASDLMWY